MVIRVMKGWPETPVMESRRNVLKAVSGGILGTSVLQHASDLDSATSHLPDQSQGAFLGTTGPAEVYRRDGDSWNQIGGILVADSDASVTAITSYDGALYAGVTTNKDMDSGSGQVWRYSDQGPIPDHWEKAADGLQNEVTTLAVYDGDLYAGTAYGSAKLFKRESGGSWTKVVDESQWNGFAASQPFDGDLYLGDSLYDKFGRYDGSQFVQEANRGGSCVFDLVSYNGELFAGALYGYMYERNGGSWDRVSSDTDSALFAYGVYDDTMYAGDENGKLYEWTGNDLLEIHQFDDSVVAMEGSKNGLLIGTGVNAAEYAGTGEDDGIAAVSRYADGSIETISMTDQFGDAAQVITNLNESCPEPTLRTHQWPYSALTPTESPMLTATIDPGCNQPSDLTIMVEGKYHLTDPKQPNSTVRTGTIVDTKTSVTENDMVEVEVEFQNAGSLMYESPIGYELEYDLTLEADEQTLINTVVSPQSYVFKQTDRVACITAKANNRASGNLKTTSSSPGLFDFMRSKAEYLNQFWASGLGNMGAKGFQFDFVTDIQNPPSTVEKGWLKLDNNWSSYTSSGTATRFMDEALAKAHNHLDINWEIYDTTAVVNEKKGNQRLSNPFWMGRIPPNIEFDFDLFTFDVEFDTDAVDLPVKPRKLPDSASVDYIDSLHVVRTGEAWQHEFGHAMGPGNQIGFPEMYEPIKYANLGIIGDWGIMDEGDAVSGFIRSAVGKSVIDPTSSWLNINSHVHVIDDTSITTDEPLTEKELGDDLNWMFTAWASVSVDVDIDWPDVDVPIWGGGGFGGDVGDVDVDVEATEPYLGFYVFEQRSGRKTNIKRPDDSKSLSTSPEQGIALYRFDTIDLKSLDKLKKAVSEANLTIPISADSFELNYLPPHGGESDVKDPGSEPVTLSDHTKSKYYDPATGTTFHLDRKPSQTAQDPKVTAKRDMGFIIENLDNVADWAIQIVVDYVGDFLKDHILYSEESIPGLEVIAETPDGRRVGVDPETGDLVNEIDGALITGPINDPRITVPGHEDISITVTANRFRNYLRERDIDPPKYVPYNQTVIVDDTPEVVDRDGIAYIEGRTTHRAPGTAGTDLDRPAVTNVPVSVRPPKINAKSNGKWVTAWIGIPEGGSANSLLLESTTLASVQAVSDETYGFVKNPATKHKDGRQFVKVKFPRQNLIDALGTGTHSASLSAQVGPTTIFGSVDIEVKQPGNGKKNKGNGKQKGTK